MAIECPHLALEIVVPTIGHSHYRRIMISVANLAEHRRDATLNWPLVKSTAVAGLGGLLFGFDTAVIAGATAQLRTAFSLGPQQMGITVSSALIGTIFGAMLAGLP